MRKIYLLSLLILSLTWNSFSQEITETNTDVIYSIALKAYKAQNYANSLSYTQKGLQLAPEYHDIRILQVRNLWALGKLKEADEDMNYLIKNVPEYPDVKPIAIQRVNYFEKEIIALEYITKLEEMYPEDNYVQMRKTQLLLKVNRRDEARKLALKLIEEPGISGSNRYVLQQILNRTVTDVVGINYQYIDFSKEYSKEFPWQSISLDYQHNFNRTAVIGRINYSDRGTYDAYLYELEAYPVFSDRFYAFTNIGVSDGSLFPDLKSSLSLYYNFAEIFEIETGGRMLFADSNSYFTGILGLTVYQGKFYLNARTFIGPKRAEKLVQNYQANVRYYIGNADNYIFLRLGSGISPDESTIFTQVQDNPNLKVFYGNLGLNKSLGIHHLFQIGAGIIHEDITSNRQGNQLVVNAGYRYRF